MKHDKEKRVFLVKKKYELHKITLVKRAWRTKFKNTKAPSTNTINSIISKFEKMGLVTSESLETAKQSGLREEAKKLLKTVITENPSLSIRKASCATDFSYSLCRYVLKHDLKLKPYKKYYVQKLNEPDYSKRLDFGKLVP